MLRLKLSIAPFILNCANLSAKLGSPRVLCRSVCSSAVKNSGAAKLKLSTDQAKDQVLFVVDNAKYFRLMNIFGFTQLMFWTSIGVAAKDMKTSAQPLTSDASELSWWQKLDLAKYKVPLSTASFCIGWAVLSGCWLHTIRSVKHIVLRKGGTSVTIATSTPFGGTRYITRPLKQLTAKSSRMEGSYMTLKVQGKPFHFLVDTRGNFVRPELFDRTVGVRRDLQSRN